MTDDEIRIRLRGIGMTPFVRYFHIFESNASPSQKRVALQRAVHVEEQITYTLGTAQTKVGKATKIISEGAAQRALHIILSSRVEEDVIDKAQALLNRLSAAK